MPIEVLQVIPEDRVIGFPKPKPRVLDKRQSARDKATNWAKVSKLVKARDLVCRVCKGPGNHIHHIVYRSHGGKDVPSNLILTCADCHRDIHAKVTLVDYKPIHPAMTILFTRNTQWDKETA
jgi:5-methylcytosine-specific restriction endonuclease McrA